MLYDQCCTSVGTMPSGSGLYRHWGSDVSMPIGSFDIVDIRKSTVSGNSDFG